MFGFFKSSPKPETTAAPAAAADNKGGWFERLKSGLSKTRASLAAPLSGLFARYGKVDAALFDELEELLLLADVGVDATTHILESLRLRVKKEGISEPMALREALRAILLDMLKPLQAPLDPVSDKPFIIMLAGVNGAGKTTTIGKLANRFQAEGLKVLLAAGDTFRAAAREQLAVWGERNQVEVVGGSGNDPAAVIFDALHSAKARGYDVVLADTAGRLPTQLHLMDEIRKIRRVLERAHPGAPHEVLLVLDANTGQNALTQVDAFADAIGVTGLVLTKLDGTAKGGVILALAKRRPLPVRFIGVGETIEDLQPFDASAFVDALFATEGAA